MVADLLVAGCTGARIRCDRYVLRRKPGWSGPRSRHNIHCRGGEQIEVATDGKLSSGIAGFDAFKDAIGRGYNLVPLHVKSYADHLTPVLAYRRLVKEDDREAPSFLLESVQGGDQQGRYSFVGSQPCLEIVAEGHRVKILDHKNGVVTETEEEDPLRVLEELTEKWKAAVVHAIPPAFSGGLVGYCGYDTVRYMEPKMLSFQTAPLDDRNLPDIHMGLYENTVVFDGVSKVATIVHWVNLVDAPNNVDLEEAYDAGMKSLHMLVARLQNPILDRELIECGTLPEDPPRGVSMSNVSREEFEESVRDSQEYIKSGDIFQVVLSQRFERKTYADPFEIYRSLRIVNPSPYMIYLQARGSIIVASSPEILCRVEELSGAERITRNDTSPSYVVTNRPLAGTRRRGSSPAEDMELELDLLADEKERAEHVMLVDLGRNDVGRIAEMGTVSVDSLMEIERYSHVMHISSTVTGILRHGLTCWDALRSALPAGTISGAPKVRAMQIIDEFERVRRGPYGGGVGVIGFNGKMDMALALRTMVIETGRTDTLFRRASNETDHDRREWVVHIQAGAGIVADSVPAMEYQETLNKGAALARAIDIAENSFSS